ncbi:MAG: hypothetical protein HYT98_02925 [Candidatus Sungbacteria bacterium]|nr:hypothetical protein [Candidatus Sungbacteria bacterium]
MDDIPTMRKAIIDKLDEVKKKVELLRTTCCTPTRLFMFDELRACLETAQNGVAEGHILPADKDIYSGLVRASETIGKLAGTCCVPDRLQPYSICLAGLNTAYMKFLHLSHVSQTADKVSGD